MRCIWLISNLMKEGLVVLTCLFFGCIGLSQNSYEEKREVMVVEQIEARGVTHWGTLKAMREVPRHQFVPEGMKPSAYLDTPLPIGHKQTISQPFMVAYMTEQLRPKRGDKILEIGTGSGYQAAVLAEMVDEVFTIEIVKPLGEQARARLDSMGYKNISVRVGDGYAGWPEEAPFDGIIVTAGAEEIPQPLIDQLAEGGRMVIPVGPHKGVRQLQLLIKRKGKIEIINLMPVRFVPFTRNKQSP